MINKQRFGIRMSIQAVVRTALMITVAWTLVGSAFAQGEILSLTNWLPGDDTIDMAAGLQLAPAIGRGGDTLLAVWADHRSMPGGVGSFYETASDIYGIRLDSNGNPLDALPFVITQAQASQENPQVAWNGTHWLVVFESYKVSAYGYYEKSLAAVRVAPGGQVEDATPIPIYNVSPTGGAWAVASDGTDWVVVYETSESNSSLKAIRISAAGTVVQPPKLLMPSTYYLRYNLRLAYASGVYLFTWRDFDDTLALRFDSELNVLDASPITLVTGYSLTGLASNDSQFYIVWHETQPDFTIAVTGSRVNTDGQVLDPSGANISGNNQPQPDAITSVAWEGVNWRVTWGYDNGVRIARINAGGLVLDPGGVALTGPTSGPIAATPSGGVQIVWGSYISSENDIYTANVSSDNSAGPTTGLSLGGPMQISSDVASGIDGSMVVYRSDISGERRIMAQPLDADGNPLIPDPIQLDSGDNLYGPGIPAVAWNGSLYLAIWNNSSGIVAQRLLQDGTPVDPAPFLVTTGFGPNDVSALGDVFLVVGLRYDANPQWVYGVGARVRGSDGVVLDPAGLTLAGTFARWASVTTLGDRWLAVWHVTWSHDDMNGSTTGTFVNSDGTSPGEFSIYGPYPVGGNGINEVAVAASSNEALVLQSNEVTSGVETDLIGNIVNADGSIQPAINLTPWLGNQYRPRVAWDGSQFVVVYNEQRNRFAPSTLDPLDARSDLFGMRISPEGAIVDPRGFAFSLSPTAEAFPNVTAADGVSWLFGSIVRNEAPFAAYRVGYQSFGVGGNPWPVAVATANTSGGDVPLDVSFSSAGSIDPGGDIASYDWDFGDGTVSIEANPEHTYTVPGQYVATLTITDNQGAQTVNTVPLEVTAPNQPPVAVASADPISGPPPLDVTFSGDESYDPDGALSDFYWTFGDGSSDWGLITYHTYQQAGTYQVTLEVWDDRNASSTTTLAISVGQNNQLPVAAASADPTSGPAPLEVSFSSAGSYDPDGTIASYAWVFGDGSTSSQPNPSHTYLAAGSYTAVLTVTDNLGATASDSVTITVDQTNQLPVAAASADPTSGPAPLDVTFSSAGSYDPDGTIASYAWVFGDGSTSSQPNPSHTYLTAGPYTAVLTVTDNLGATHTDSVTITVYGKVIANFSGSPTIGSVPLLVSFINDSTGNYEICAWDFGDGGTSNSCENVTHVYTTPGLYTVELTVSGPGGADTETRSDYIQALPLYQVYLPSIQSALPAGTAGSHDR